MKREYEGDFAARARAASLRYYYKKQAEKHPYGKPGRPKKWVIEKENGNRQRSKSRFLKKKDALGLAIYNVNKMKRDRQARAEKTYYDCHDIARLYLLKKALQL